MSDGSCRATLLNMCMVEDKKNGHVLVLNKVGSRWDGITFPGGHAEEGESMTEAAIREVREETGLTVSNLSLCGLVHEYHVPSKERRIVFLYKTDCFSGTLAPTTQEGNVFWISSDQLNAMPLSPGFDTYLRIFRGEAHEAFCQWTNGKVGPFCYL